MNCRRADQPFEIFVGAPHKIFDLLPQGRRKELQLKALFVSVLLTL